MQASLREVWALGTLLLLGLLLHVSPLSSLLLNVFRSHMPVNNLSLPGFKNVS